MGPLGGRALMNGISALIKHTWENSPAPSSLQPCKDTVSQAPERWPSPHHAGTQISHFQPPGCEKYIPVVYKPLSIWYFVLAAWPDQERNKAYEEWYTKITMANSPSTLLVSPPWYVCFKLLLPECKATLFVLSSVFQGSKKSPFSPESPWF